MKYNQGLTQEKLGELMGVSQGTIGHWLNGRRKPRNPQEFEKLANLIGVDASYLMYGKKESGSQSSANDSDIQSSKPPPVKVPYIEKSRIHEWLKGESKITTEDYYSIPNMDPGCFCFTLEDVSMEPRFIVGDVVCINPKSPLEAGTFVGFDFRGNGEITMGRYVKKGMNGILEVEKGEDILIDESNADKYIGSVKAVVLKCS